MKYRWMNNYTGELYKSIAHAIKTIIEDMIRCDKCRTIKMLSVSRFGR